MFQLAETGLCRAIIPKVASLSTIRRKPQQSVNPGIDLAVEQEQSSGMSAYEALLKELAGQPDSIARKLLDYLHAIAPTPTQQNGVSPAAGGHFSRYWSCYYGAFEGEEWDEPCELPFEKREEW